MGIGRYLTMCEEIFLSQKYQWFR